MLTTASRSFLRYISVFFLGISIFSLLLITLLTIRLSNNSLQVPFHKESVGSLFILICGIGILLGVFPSKCVNILHFKSSNGSSQKAHTVGERTGGKFRGHHPICQHFTSHVLQMNKTTVCAGCTGLILGAVISIVGSIFYFFLHISLGAMGLLFLLGFLGILIGLLQYHLPYIHQSTTHLLVNGAFVVSAFLLLIGVDAITQNIFLELYLLLIILFWIITRITLSQFEHKRICTKCTLKNCTYK
jgi:hypothetical protein